MTRAVFENCSTKATRPAALGADTAYRSAKNERHLDLQGFVSKIHFRRTPGKPLSRRRSKANAARGKVRAGVEHVFAVQKGPMGLFIRTIGLDRARTKIGRANLAYNFKRYVWSERQAPMA